MSFVDSHRLSIALAAGLLAVVTTTAPVSAESWTSLHGGSTVEAKMIGLWGDSVVLEMEDGRRITVSLSDLRAESRIQARDLAKAHTAARSTLVNEFKAQAKEAAAPAPNPIPKPPAAPAYVQPKPNAKVIEQLILVDEQSRAGHMVAVFDALPPSYRKDVSDLAKLGAKKINAESWDSLIAAIHSVGDVIVTRQRWVFTHPRLETMTPATLEPIQDIVLLVAGLIREGFDPEEMDLTQLQSMPLRDWMMARDQTMSPYFAALNEYSHGMGQQTFELVSEKDGVATVKASVGEFSVNVAYSTVEGFWVPKEWADNWSEWMKQAREKLDATPDGSMLTDPMTAMIPGMIQPVINPMLGASDKKSFHAAMESMFAQAAPIATLAGVDLSGKRRRGSSGYDDYGDTETEMDEMSEEDYEQQMSGEYDGTSPGTGGSSDANPNIGARLEDKLRGRP